MSAPPIARLGFVTTDSHDPERLAAFWSRLLNVEVETRLGNPSHYVVLNQTGQGVPALSFQRVPENKAVKNRQHLDLIVADLEEATSEIVALGGRRGEDVREYGLHWRTMLDLEGNEFCLFPAGTSLVPGPSTDTRYRSAGMTSRAKARMPGTKSSGRLPK